MKEPLRQDFEKTNYENALNDTELRTLCDKFALRDAAINEMRAIIEDGTDESQEYLKIYTLTDTYRLERKLEIEAVFEKIKIR